MSDLSDRLNSYKLRAQRHKKAAIEARSRGDSDRAKEEFEEAKYTVDEALEEIESRGSFNPDLVGHIDQATKDQASAFADWWGIRGGIYREEGEIAKAIDAYDTGFRFENERKYEINSTYNTVNRLVLRLLRDPDLLKSPGSSNVDSGLEKPITDLLTEAGQAIEAKWQKMTDPVWALADMVMIKSILQAPDSAEWEERFKENAKDRFPFDSIGALLDTLARSKLPMSKALHDLAVRLDRFVVEKTWL
jgi:tetratricopeptide (TPR) repeat protein